MDHNFALWRWNPQSVEIVDKKWLGDVFGNVEIKVPPLWAAELAQENFLDTQEVLKQMEALISGNGETSNWMDPIPIDIP